MIATCVVVSVRPAITNSLWPGGAQVLVDPHFLGVLVDAAIGAALGFPSAARARRASRRTRDRWARRSLHGRGPDRVRRSADKPYNVRPALTALLIVLAIGFAWSIGAHYTGAVMGMPHALRAIGAWHALLLMAPLAFLGATFASHAVEERVGSGLTACRSRWSGRSS